MADASFATPAVPPLFSREIALPATDLLGVARRVLLEPTGLEDHHLSRLLGRLMAPGVDMADLYFQHELHESWSLEDSIIKGGSHSTSQGVGVRAVAGERTGLAYAEDLDFAAIDDAARAARAIVKGGQEGIQPVLSPRPSAPMLYPALNPLDGWPVEKKLSLLRRADAAARAADPRVIQVMANLNGVYEVILVVDEQGRLAADVRPLVRLNVSVIVEQDGRREQSGSGQGGRGSYETFFGGDEPETLAAEAVRQATLLLTARPAPAGAFPVVLGSGWPGVLLHEAVGHTLEGDFNRKGSSLFSNRVGQRVVSDKVTVVDDGTLPHRRGSLTVDDEGTPAGRTVMIENGVLQGYIQDRLNARLMGVKPTGNGRRESFAALPMPRMTNTYMTPGTDAPEDILRSVKDGIYAVNFGGGQVDITTGNFTFSASEAYRIENGKVTYPVRGATLIGNGIDVLERISMVGHDLALDKGIGVCGKEGQSVPVGVGQPTLKIDQITVGGTKGA